MSKQINIDTKIKKNKNIEDTDLDGNKVMMNLQKGRYFMMNEVGSRIWELINEPIKVNYIIDELLNEFRVDRATCEKEVMNFIQELFNGDLIEVIN